jgi:predicted phosphate transport protein (TIGR00153 family)
MLTIARLFGKSPFSPLQNHMEKVSKCVETLTPLIENLIDQKFLEITQISEEISKLEHDADLTKNDIRNHLPKSLFLPIERGTLLEILSIQDQLADQAEVIGHLAALRSFAMPNDMKEDFRLFYKKNLEAFTQARDIMEELEELLESSFGGIEAEKVKSMVEQVAYLEYEANLQKRKLLKLLYAEDALPHPVFNLLALLVDEIGKVSHFSENLGNRVRMLLEIK